MNDRIELFMCVRRFRNVLRQVTEGGGGRTVDHWLEAEKLIFSAGSYR